MNHSHSGHAHSHSHAGHGADEGRLRLAFLLTGGFMLAEIVGGLMANSLALLADAGHMLSDTFALGAAFAAIHIARRPADHKRSYGYQRMQVLAAFTNALLLMGISALIVFEAAQRLFEPASVMGMPMLIIAGLGFAVNIAAFFLLHGADHTNLNIKGAFAHVIGDLLGSVAAILAAIIILTTGWMLADPLLSMLVAGLIVRTGLPILKESAHILLEGSPRGYSAEAITETLIAEIPEVLDVHHVHIWSLDSARPIITLHVVLAEEVEAQAGLCAVKAKLTERFGLSHATVQIEPPEHCED